MNEQEMVKEFHKAFGLLISDQPNALETDAEVRQLRLRLIEEELEEYKVALIEGDIVEIAKELADLLYVIYGAGVSHGIDLHEVFKEVHRSNMTKKGGHKDAGGKWIKPETYEAANLTGIIFKVDEQDRADRWG